MSQSEVMTSEELINFLKLMELFEDSVTSVSEEDSIEVESEGLSENSTKKKVQVASDLSEEDSIEVASEGVSEENSIKKEVQEDSIEVLSEESSIKKEIEEVSLLALQGRILNSYLPSEHKITSINDLCIDELSHILTFLPMKDTIANSGLSRSWRYMQGRTWT
ncbi:FBD-associated F-box protein [Trifolium repens]|jgi:hypothetical protein|nr:FBD-associated F-box protein [Trifolium repens]